MSKTIHIIGSGFSGLTLAWELRKRGLDVHVYEKSDRTGGLIHSERTSTHLRESAANGLMWNERLQAFSEELDFPFYPAKEESKVRYIYRSGLRRWPLNGIESLRFAKNILRLFWRLKIKKDESIRPQPQESVADWVVRNFSVPTHEYLVKPALQGIYAGNTSEMSAQLIFKGFLSGKRSPRNLRGTFSPKDGMGSFLQTLERKLLQKEVRFSMGHAIEQGETPPLNEPWVLATSAWEAARIAELKNPGLAKKLAQIRGVPLFSATLTWRHARERLNGFGCLFPEKEKFYSLGVLANTEIFENRGPFYAETWILGGALNPNLAILKDEDILNEILKDRVRVLGTDQKPDEFFIQRYDKAIPQYDLQLEKILDEIKDLPHQDLFLTGNYLGHLGLAKIYDDNILLAEKIAQLYNAESSQDPR